MKEIERDPIELTKQYLEIEPELNKKINAELKDVHRRLGYCHRYWRVKKEILKKDYNMEWRSPAELNPFIIYD